jgi:hypothetical protein
MDLRVYMNLWGTKLMYELRMTLRADNSMHTTYIERELTTTQGLQQRSAGDVRRSEIYSNI